MTPQAPTNDRPPIEQTPQGAPQQQRPIMPPPTPPVWQPVPPDGWYPPPVMPPQQQRYFTPTPAQRLGLAVASLALLIPLFAIAVGIISPLVREITAGLAVTVGLILAAFVCLTVVGVNVIFNYDLLRRQR